MKGVISICLTEMIMAKFGDKKLMEILQMANLSKYTRFLPIENVPDEDVLAIFNAACENLNLSLEKMAEMFGVYWCVIYAPKIYRPYFESAKDAKSFLLAMQRIHAKVTLVISNATPPAFEYIDEAPNRLIMKYISKRNLQTIWIGVIKGVGVAFNEKLDLKMLDENTVEIIFSPAEDIVKELKG